MGHEELPKYTPVESTKPKKQHGRSRPHRRHRRRAFRVVFLAVLAYSLYSYWNPRPLNISVRDGSPKTLNVAKLQQDYAVGPRSKNARWNGSPATLIKNTTIWTGEAVHGNYSWVSGDVLIQYGLLTQVASHIATANLPDDTVIHDGTGRMLTSGIIDMHSHTGVDALPNSRGGEDTNELSSDTTPYVRSIDGFNPLDPQIQIIKSGGVTTSLILPGSGNNIGGEAYVLKHAVGPLNGRSEISADDMLADPDRNWRYMKMACGENAKRVYGRVGRHFGPSAIDVLHAAGVKLRLGTEEDWQTRDLYLYAGIAMANSGGNISEKEALGLVCGGLFEDTRKKEKVRGWVVSEGSVLEGGRVRAVSDGVGGVDVWA
ncbi:hypothetical protein LTR95_009325 [Oleoguttula sp. CCFEE 5521]